MRPDLNQRQDTPTVLDEGREAARGFNYVRFARSLGFKPDPHQTKLLTVDPRSITSVQNEMNAFSRLPPWLEEL